MTNKKLSPWIILDGYSATRVIFGTDPLLIENRVAFIEKTPRVLNPITKEWEYGPKGLGGNLEKDSNIYGSYPPSRQWCDEMLISFGYELSE